MRSDIKETAAEYDNFLFSCMLVGVGFEVYNCFVGVFWGYLACWGWVFGRLYMSMGVKTNGSGCLDGCLSF